MPSSHRHPVLGGAICMKTHNKPAETFEGRTRREAPVTRAGASGGRDGSLLGQTLSSKPFPRLAGTKCLAAEGDAV